MSRTKEANLAQPSTISSSIFISFGIAAAATIHLRFLQQKYEEKD